MANLIELAKQSADELLREAYQAAVAAGALPAGAELTGTVEIPKDVSNGDYAANHAMVCARALHLPPRKIAEALAAHCALEGSFFSSVSVAGPGFINFRLSGRWYSEVLRSVREEGMSYGHIRDGEGKRVNVEFVSANPTGPMHLGNARGGVLGDALASVLSFAGYEVSREFYVNDAGNQIEKFASSIDARYHQLAEGKIDWPDLPEKEEDRLPDVAYYDGFPADGYHGEDIKELAKAFYAQEGDAWLDKPEAERHAAMAKFGLARNIPKMKEDLRRYGVEYDRWFLESELHESGFVKATVDRLTEMGFTYEKDGALWLRTAEILGSKLLAEGKSEEAIAKLDLKDDVLRRSNGFYTYFAADIAYHRNKLEIRGFDKAINIWGADHHGHIARLKGAMDALDLDGEHRLDIVLMQLVKLMRDGKPERMSKRTGKAISLTDLLDEVPVDAARYFFNTRPESPVEFDLDLAVRQDSENPVYYVLSSSSPPSPRRSVSPPATMTPAASTSSSRSWPPASTSSTPSAASRTRSPVFWKPVCFSVPPCARSSKSPSASSASPLRSTCEFFRDLCSRRRASCRFIHRTGPPPVRCFFHVSAPFPGGSGAWARPLPNALLPLPPNRPIIRLDIS